MLDTNILIYLIKHKPESVVQRANALGDDDELYMSFVTYAELLKGAEGSGVVRVRSCLLLSSNADN